MAKETPVVSAVFLVLYTAALALYLLLATGFRGIFVHPRSAPAYETLFWQVADWAAVSVCLVADAYLVSSMLSYRRSKKATAPAALLPPPPPQMDMC
ncbi:hypothetical protein GUJ93_ZPchr0007g3986 [Zizania palustris]|uniref:Uncharacterized protein n=1 Tax=Zizania palustris TaxID=103762 RepID=A0A8J5W6K6_ZIZPA|nr:hypothetical protein GUJ93_ZPchr0007g3986 [Zizania palustris]